MRGPSRVVEEKERKPGESEENVLVSGDTERSVPRGIAVRIEVVEYGPCSADEEGVGRCSACVGTEAMQSGIEGLSACAVTLEGVSEWSLWIAAGCLGEVPLAFKPRALNGVPRAVAIDGHSSIIAEAIWGKLAGA